MDIDINERVNMILEVAYKEGFGQSTEPLSRLAIETIKELNILQDNLDRNLKQATEKTLNLMMTQ